jgi:hypothetical protein
MVLDRLITKLIYWVRLSLITTTLFSKTHFIWIKLWQLLKETAVRNISTNDVIDPWFEDSMPCRISIVDALWASVWWHWQGKGGNWLKTPSYTTTFAYREFVGRGRVSRRWIRSSWILCPYKLFLATKTEGADTKDVFVAK